LASRSRIHCVGSIRNIVLDVPRGCQYEVLTEPRIQDAEASWMKYTSKSPECPDATDASVLVHTKTPFTILTSGGVATLRDPGVQYISRRRGSAPVILPQALVCIMGYYGSPQQYGLRMKMATNAALHTERRRTWNTNNATMFEYFLLILATGSVPNIR